MSEHFWLLNEIQTHSVIWDGRRRNRNQRKDHKLARSFESLRKRQPRRWRQRERRRRSRKLVWKVVLRDYVVSGFELKIYKHICARGKWLIWMYTCELYAMVCGQKCRRFDGIRRRYVVRFIGHLMRCRWHSLRVTWVCVRRARARLLPTTLGYMPN